MKKVVGGTVITTEEITELIAKANKDEYINIDGFSLVNVQTEGDVRVRINDGDILDLAPGEGFYGLDFTIISCEIHGVGSKVKWAGVL